MKKSVKRVDTRKITLVAVLAALATVLMFVQFSVPFMPAFLKFDVSNMPALIASFAVSPIGGAIVCLVKNLFNLINTSTGGIGELSDFILGCLFVVPAGLIYKYKRTFWGAIIGCLVGTVTMSLVSVVTNYYILYPVYANIMPISVILNMYNAIYPKIGDDLVKALFVFNVPFTALKGIGCSLITIVVYKRISNLMRKDFKKKKAVAVPTEVQEETPLAENTPKDDIINVEN